MGAMQMGAAGIRVRIGHYEDGTLKKNQRGRKLLEYNCQNWQLTSN